MDDQITAIPNDSAPVKYDPNHLLDVIIEKLSLKNDAALAKALDVTPPVISRIRHEKIAIGATLLIAMHEETGLSVRELRDLMGDRRGTYRESAD